MIWRLNEFTGVYWNNGIGQTPQAQAMKVVRFCTWMYTDRKAHDHKDVGGKATQGAVAEDVRERSTRPYAFPRLNHWRV